MKFNFFINKIMTKKAGILATVAVATALSTAPVSAETNDQVAKQKVEHITCSTRLACEKLSLSIQAQIDELKAKGNLTSREKFKIIKLNKQLLATKDSTIAVEKQETKEEQAETAQKDQVIATKDSIIAVENNKQAKQLDTIAQENQKQKAYSEVSDKLASIEGSLL